MHCIKGMNQINSKLNSRTAIKFNHIQMTESGKVYICHENDQGISLPLYEVKSRLLKGDFDNMVTIAIDGANGCFGPNVQPSQKGIKRLTSILAGTSYKIVQQVGQTFTIGVN